MTYTYAVLEVSRGAYDEIAGKLKAAGYGQAFHDDADDGGQVIDMHGIALRAEAPPDGRPLMRGGQRGDKTLRLHIGQGADE